MADTDMTQTEREEFLAGVHVAVLAIEHPGHGPLAVPIWYSYDGGQVILRMDASSLKARLLRAAGRATLTVQDEQPPYKYVSVEGPVTVAREPDDVAALASRYLGPELGAWYAQQNPDSEASVTVRLTPERWRTVDYGKTMG
jgi:PPOX class probable F420-dependent enzyme